MDAVDAPDAPTASADPSQPLPPLEPPPPPIERKDDGYVTPPLSIKPEPTSSTPGTTETVGLSYSPATSGANKRKRVDMASSAICEAAETAASLIAASNLFERPAPIQRHVTVSNSMVTIGRSSDLSAPSAKRKSSSDFLRKGQWTTTEERLARLLIEAFEEGYLPIYTGIRLRGYLAVQLQCDPMRVSKKLCAGTVDGKRVPKNYGQKKFKLRKKGHWDRDEAGRILAALEKLTDELWREAAVSRPPFLTLSSTRNADEHESHAAALRDGAASPASPVRRLSPSVSKKHKSVVFPIIYLNLSKKHKQHPSASSAGHSSTSSSTSGSEADPTGDSTPAASEDDDGHQAKKHKPTAVKKKKTRSARQAGGKIKRVDGESLQAAYDLLTLCQPASTTDRKKKPTTTPTSTSVSAPTPALPTAPAPTAAAGAASLPTPPVAASAP